MSTRNKIRLPAPTPEIEAALEEVRDLLDTVDTSTDEGTIYALSLLRERRLPDSMIFIAKHQPKELTSDAKAWAERILRADGVLP